MNLARTLRAFAAIVSLAVGIAAPADAQISAFFTPGNSCVAGTAQPVDVSYSPGGAPVNVSLCMKSDTPAALTCGFTAVLEAAVAGESGLFTVTGVSRTGSPFQDANTSVPPLPLAIATSPVTVADFGATVSSTPLVPAAGASAILLATFTISPSASATNGSYVIKLNSVSAAAVDSATPNNNCGTTDIPSDAPLTGSFNMKQSTSPVFTSANATTFSSTSTNSFTVTAVGIPSPTLTLTGSLPSGVSFNAGTGVLSSTAGVVNGVYTFTFNANNGSGPVPQPFTLTVSGQASQTITFANPGSKVYSSTPFPVSATSTSGLAVTLTSQSPTICTVFGGNVTMVTLGTCTIVASQAGNATYLPAPSVTQVFGITGSVPGAPTIVSATPGDARAVVSFTAPTTTGGSSITLYTATCGSTSATGSGSPISVNGLTNGTPYNCSVSATNALGTGPSSASLPVTPSNASTLTLLGVKSRKSHTGFAAPFDLAIDTSVALSGSVTVEPRVISTGHQIVFQFNNPITAGGSATVLDSSNAVVGSAPVITFSGNEVIVTITGVPDKSRVAITLTNVNGVATPFVAPIGFLVGDVNNNRQVNAGDQLGTTTRSGVPLDLTNFRFDVNLNGAINVGDTLACATRSGNNLNP